MAMMMFRNVTMVSVTKLTGQHWSNYNE
jgi:hypothetical protein